MTKAPLGKPERSLVLLCMLCALLLLFALTAPEERGVPYSVSLSVCVAFPVVAFAGLVWVLKG